MKKVLAPIDFSDNSDKSLQFAIELCLAFKSELYILHSFDMLIEFNEAVDPTIIYQKYFDESKLKFEELINQYKSQYSHLPIHAFFEAGSPIDAISNINEKYNMDLVIVGRTGASGLESFLVGSTTTRIINHINTPILVIPNFLTYQYMITGSILLSTDLSTFPFEKDAQLVNQFQKITNQKIHLIHYREDNTEINRINENRILALFPSAESIEYINNGTFLETIYAFSETHDAKLLVLISKKKTFWQRFFEGHRTTRIANETIYPLLILAEDKKQN